jgi:hypothetical protein
MKVKRIKVQNVKAIKDQELNLNGSTAIIMAGNNKGKSTLLKTLKDRLLKLKPDQLVRHGETEGFYIMEMTDGSRIEWELSTKTKAGEKMTLISKDGNKTSAITDIIKWFGPSNFDIDKFLNATPAAQRKTLEALLGLDFSSLDEKLAKATEERKDANRDVERLEVNYKGKAVDKELPLEPTPTDGLEKELLGVETHNEKWNLLVDEEARLIEERKELMEELRKVNDRLAVLDDKMSNPDLQPKKPEYVIDLTDRLHIAKLKNARIEENNKLRTALEDLVELKDVAHEKDLAVKDILEQKDKMIREANMPEGFGFTEDGITYNNLPLTREQLSSSAIYIAALKLASVNVGNVRMLHFDASLLDNESLQQVRDWAEGQDLQLLIELVDRDGEDIRYEIVEDNWLDS